MMTGTTAGSQQIDPNEDSGNEFLPQRSRELSGRYLVLGVLSLGIAATTILFIYWERQTRPFRPLREAIGREFRHSRPNVEGGRPKGRGPWTLRVSMTVEFPPAEDSARANEIFNRVIEIAREYYNVKKIDRVEVNLIQFVPQELAKTRKFVWTADGSSDIGKSE
jgi:hypothetical protein